MKRFPTVNTLFLKPALLSTTLTLTLCYPAIHSVNSFADEGSIYSSMATAQPIYAKHGMV